MSSVIAWCGFLGAWLLVAGPLFQAATELEDSDDARDAMTAVSARLDPQPRLSPWWWLLPPVAYVKQRRRARVYRDAVFHALPTPDLEEFVAFNNKATGWLTVAVGAFFIAVKETWEVVELDAWPWWALVVLTVAMLVLATANTVVRLRRAHAMLAESRRTAAAA